MTTILRTVLREHHLQSHGAFLMEYNRCAENIDPTMVGRGPCKTQFHRWLSGELQALPRSSHCRVLEAMFPDWSAGELFATAEPGSDDGTLAGIVGALTTRARLPNFKRDLSIVGVSLNMLCQNYSERALLDLVESGGHLKALFLDPDGVSIAVREQEEGHPEGTLRKWTASNIGVMQRIRSHASPEAAGWMELRAYDEPPRLHIVIVDGSRCQVAPYLPDRRGVDSPTFVIEDVPGTPGMFQVFTETFDGLWNRGKRID